MPQLFVPKETRSGEARVAVTPETIQKFKKAGWDVAVERDAGAGAFISDEEFTKAGASLTDAASGFAQADIVMAVRALSVEQAKQMKQGACLVAGFAPQSETELVQALMDQNLSCFSMNLVPRITIAQKMDTLSSQASLAGYKAVLLAANHLRKYFPLLMTAAGTITPAKVVVLGAGVAGLQAIATARRLGALVEASDVRLAVKEQVESLGAKFIEVESEESLEDEGGYAKEQSEDFLRRQREEVARRVAQSDIVISTALIPGRPAPKLITSDMVKSMADGSVIVDMAVETGGNCELSEYDKVVVKEGVTIIGEPNLASLMSVHASQMLARNMFNFVTHVFPEGEVAYNLEDEVTDGALLTHEAKLRHEPTRQAMQGG